MDLIDMLGPRPGERILDAGCGTGEFTRMLVDRGADVTGLDKSACTLEQARLACPEATFIHGDLLEFTAEIPFDGVFSKGVLHWIHPPELAASRIFAALKPGGRMVAEFGGVGNVEEMWSAAGSFLDIVKPSVLRYWYQPTPQEYASLLESVGFEVLLCVLSGWLTEGCAVGVWELSGAPLPASSEPDVVTKLCDALRGEICREGGGRMDRRRLRVVARRPQ